ncbi:MAG: hypothetical protein ACKVQA_05890, partial [Burkholderiales bacterium]
MRGSTDATGPGCDLGSGRGVAWGTAGPEGCACAWARTGGAATGTLAAGAGSERGDAGVSSARRSGRASGRGSERATGWAESGLATGVSTGVDFAGSGRASARGAAAGSTRCTVVCGVVTGRVGAT